MRACVYVNVCVTHDIVSHENKTFRAFENKKRETGLDVRHKIIDSRIIIYRSTWR